MNECLFICLSGFWTDRSAEYFKKYVEYFNSLYYKFERVDDYENFERFQSFLDIYGTDENETYYHILRTVKKVSCNINISI